MNLHSETDAIVINRLDAAFGSVATHVVEAVAALCLLAVPAAAQDFTGTWYGKIESPINNQYRKLVVTTAGTKLSCAFVNIAATSGADSTCSIEGGTLQLVTATQNRVRLASSGDMLDGTTTSAATGKSFHIRMAHDPAQVGIPSSVPISSSYTFGMAPQPAAGDKSIGSQTAATQSISLCGQKVGYAPPQTNSTSVAGSSLVGVWEGERGEPNPQGQEATICTGFIIGTISSDGKIQATHAWGDSMHLLSNGNGIAIKPGVAPWQGQLTNDTVVWAGNNASDQFRYEMRLAGPDKMRGKYQNKWGTADARLTRQISQLKR